MSRMLTNDEAVMMFDAIEKVQRSRRFPADSACPSAERDRAGRGNGMRLWLLRPVGYTPDRNGAWTDGTAWSPWYDAAFGFVIRAETEAEARLLAHDRGQTEALVDYVHPPPHPGSPWIDPAQSTCVPLTDDGPAGPVIEDVQWA